jgi:hypothetical protein
MFQYYHSKLLVDVSVILWIAYRFSGTPLILSDCRYEGLVEDLFQYYHSKLLVDVSVILWIAYRFSGTPLILSDCRYEGLVEE